MQCTRAEVYLQSLAPIDLEAIHPFDNKQLPRQADTPREDETRCGANVRIFECGTVQEYLEQQRSVAVVQTLKYMLGKSL